MFSALSAVTRREGFPSRDELIGLYEEASGRSVSSLRWYQTLALWKAAVFMEGNYKRSLAGTTDDPYLKLFDEGVPALAEAAWTAAKAPGSQHVNGLLVDFGGVLTTNVFDSFRAFCVDQGLDPDASGGSSARTRRRSGWCGGLETGAVSEQEFGERFGALLGIGNTAGLVDRMFSGLEPDEAMLGGAARRTGGGHPHRTDLELDGCRALRPRRLPRALRRRGDLRRRGPAQATARDLPARLRTSWTRAGGVRVRGRSA